MSRIGRAIALTAVWIVGCTIYIYAHGSAAAHKTYRAALAVCYTVPSAASTACAARAQVAMSRQSDSYLQSGLFTACWTAAIARLTGPRIGAKTTRFPMAQSTDKG